MLCGYAAQIWRFSILIHFLKSAHALFEYVEYRVPTLTTTALEASTVCYLQENQVNFLQSFQPVFRSSFCLFESLIHFEAK